MNQPKQVYCKCGQLLCEREGDEFRHGFFIIGFRRGRPYITCPRCKYDTHLAVDRKNKVDFEEKAGKL